jgi:predicted RNase H-like HicB family nuclease
MDKYEIILYWSDKDKLYVAEVPELPGCSAHGKSREEALEQISQAIQLWVETAKEFGDPIPEPKGRRLKFA